jgi:GT2 family glycosyltransferase/2-polyprenyl-3-methyl-5-hydroxy-6-metoxy-1,4-benzoquinol methylase
MYAMRLNFQVVRRPQSRYFIILDAPRTAKQMKENPTLSDGPSKYEFSVDLNNENLAHTLMVKLVGTGKELLDVGCASGYLDRVFMDQACIVTGIEANKNAAELARRYCREVFTADIEAFDWKQKLRGHSFDVILFGDVLEHLKDPGQVLANARASLAPGGYVVASIPNVAHASLRLQLLQGEFRYRPLGLLDETHIRFFTYDTIKEMFDKAGFVIGEIRRVKLGPFDTEIVVDRGKVPQEIVDYVLQDTEATTYQFVLRAVPKDQSPGAYRFEKLEGELGLARNQIKELENHIADLEHELGKQKVEFEEQLRVANENLQLSSSHNEVLLVERQHLEADQINLAFSDSHLFPHIDIVVVTYNSAQHLPRFFRSVRRLDYPKNKMSLVVVDNQSADRSVEVSRIHSLDLQIEFELISHPQNVGFAGGAKIGMAKGKGDFICVVNPDSEYDPYALRELMSAVSMDPSIAIADARQFPYEHPKYYDPSTNETSWCSGACCLIRRSALEKVGSYDERFFMYCEDVDLSWRFWSSGYKCVYAPKAIILHHKAPQNYRPAFDYFYGVRNGILMRLIYGDLKAIIQYYRGLLREIESQSDPTLRMFLKKALFVHVRLLPHALGRRISKPKSDSKWIKFSGINYGEHRW